MRKILTLAAIFVAPIAALAQVSGSSFFSQIASDWHAGFSFDSNGEFLTPADVHGYGSSGTLSNYGASGTLKFEAAKDRHAFTFNIGYSYLNYDFSSDYFNFSDTNKVFFRAFYTGRISDRWGAFAIVSTSSAAAKEAKLMDGMQGLFGAGASYAFSENLQLGLGMAAYSRLDNTWLPLPAGFLNWKINDSLSLRVFEGVALVWDVFKDGTLTLNASGEYKNSYFRIHERGNVKRSFCDSSYEFTIGANYNFSEFAYISASIGGNFGRELGFRSNSVSAEDIDVDAAAVFYIHAGVRF